MGTYQQVSPPVPQQRGWFSRHWKLVVFGGIGVVFLGVVLFVCGIVLLVFSSMKSSEPYQHAVAAAQASPDVQRALGTPINTGMFLSGQINVTGASGNADLAIPIHGPKGKATLYVVAEKSAGEWEYKRIDVKPEGSATRIKLVSSGTSSEEEPPPSQD